MNIIFFGTPAFAQPFLEALIDDAGVSVQAVVTQPDKPQGRGAVLTSPPVKQLADTHGIPVFQPESLKKDTQIHEELAAFQADVFIVVAYGKIIPQSILDIPKHGTLNVHPSLLPKYRGPSPMQWAIREGDAQTGVTIMLLDAGMDTGPLLAQETIKLAPNDTYHTLALNVANVGPPLLLKTLKRFINGEIEPCPQDEQEATLTRLLKKEDGRIDWSDSAKIIDRKRRAYTPWPGAWSIWKRSGSDTRLKFIQTLAHENRSDIPVGEVKIEDNRLFIGCKNSTLEILEIQPEGKPRMGATDFIRGYGEIEGATLQKLSK